MSELLKQNNEETTPRNSATKLIRKYENRKLYDVESGQYINLNNISSMIKLGHTVKIIEHGTKRDLTASTLMQIYCNKLLQNVTDTNIPSLIEAIKVL